MATWMVKISFGDDKQQKTIFIKNKENEDEVYYIAKQWFMMNNPTIPYWGVNSIEKI